MIQPCNACGAKSLKQCKPYCVNHPNNTRVEQVNNPAHYGGADNPYEAIKVIEAWELTFHLGNTVKYIARAGKKGANSELQDLQKAAWYLQRRITNLEKRK